MSANYNGKKTKDKLIEIAQGYNLFLDQNRVPHVWIHEEAQLSIVMKIDSDHFRGWIGNDYFNLYGTPPSRIGLEEAIYHLNSFAKAKHGKYLFPLSIRISHGTENSYIDLGGDKGELIKISSTGWGKGIASQPLFRQYEHQKKISVPLDTESSIEEGIEKLFQIIPIKTEGDKLKIIAWLISVMISKEIRPVMFFNGPQGSGKTTSSRIIKGLLDPSEHDCIIMPSDNDLPLILSQNCILLLDNNSYLKPRQVQTLCMAVTGGSLPKRKHYKDEDTLYLKFSSSLIMTAINLPSKAPDLLQRFLMVELESIQQSLYRNHSEIQKEFETHRGLILKNLLDLSVKVKQVSKDFDAISYSRFGDFCKIGQIVSVLLGKTKEDFINALKENALSQEQEILENPLFVVLRDYLEQNKGFSGTSKELLGDLKKKNPSFFEKQKTTPDYLRRFINEHIVVFQGVGFEVTSKKTSKGKTYTFRNIQKITSQTSQASQTNENKPLESNESDAGDVGDAELLERMIKVFPSDEDEGGSGNDEN